VISIVSASRSRMRDEEEMRANQDTYAGLILGRAITGVQAFC
jgi:hypothetical protein